ncbi:MAG: FecR domain-containing protein [Rhodospirillales bacterium]|nr:FecR domain-containing protein [Rhodospirillales bacterium]
MTMIRTLMALFLVPVMLVGDINSAHAELPDGGIGEIKTLDAGTFVIRGDARESAALGGIVFQGDEFETDSQGAVGITFIDGSTLSLGSDSYMEIDAFIFVPQDEKLGFAVHFLKGTAMYLSGRIAKLSPEDVKISTPLATIGIRGTRLLIQVAE